MTFKSEIVFVRILIPMILGICFCYLIQWEQLIIPYLILSLLLISCLLLLHLCDKKLKLYNFRGLSGLFFHAFCFVFGGLISLLHNQSFKNDYYAKHKFDYLKVWVNDEPQLHGDILRFEIEITNVYQHQKSKKVSGKLLVALKIDDAHPIKLNYGDELLISSEYLPIEPSYNPAEFNFKAWLATKNIYHQSFINQKSVVKLNVDKGNPILNYAIKTRQKQVEIYRKLIHNDEAFAVASTLVLGYRADLDKETLAAYSKTGTIHALSVSGMHVGIIYIFLNWALFFLNRKKWLKILKLLLITFLVWYYSLLTGFSPSVLRSAIMLTVYILAKGWNKNSNSYNVLAFTAFCLLIYNPFLIWDVGFQLSFLAVFGLIYLQPKIYKWINVKNKWLDQLWSTIALSLAAQIATFPLSIYYFHQFPLYFIFSNLFILLPLTAMMYLGIGILMLRLYVLAPIFEWIITFTNNGLKWIADLPFSGITAIWIDNWQLSLLTFTLVVFVIALVNYRKKLLLIALLSITLFQFIAAYHSINLFKQRRIVFFSLRKNYCAAFINSRDAILLSDLTVKDKNFDFFVKPTLDQMQIKNITFIKWNQDTTISSFKMSENQLVFFNHRILLLDEKFNYKRIVGLPRFNTLWLHQNPKKKIAELRNEVLFSTLIIDASNRDYLIRIFEAESNKFQLPYYTLKKNKAYLLNIKH